VEDEKEKAKAAFEAADAKAYDLFREAVDLAKQTAAARAVRSVAMDTGDAGLIAAARATVAARWEVSLAACERWQAAQVEADRLAAVFGRLNR
jgi:formiminotetrahydrofolate cyclodeaminase